MNELASSPSSASTQPEPAPDVPAGLDMLLTDGALGPLRRMLPAASGLRMVVSVAAHPATLVRRGTGLAVELARIGVGSSPRTRRTSATPTRPGRTTRCCAARCRPTSPPVAPWERVIDAPRACTSPPAPGRRRRRAHRAAPAATGVGAPGSGPEPGPHPAPHCSCSTASEPTWSCCKPFVDELAPENSRLHLYSGGHLALLTEAAELAPVIDGFLAG